MDGGSGVDDQRLPDNEPCYVISVAARLVSLHPQTLRYYDRIGLIKPGRTSGRIRLYSQRNIKRLHKIVRLTEDLGVNLAGVDVILNMSRRMQELQRELVMLREQAEAEIHALRQRIREIEETKTKSERDTQVISVSVREVDSKEDVS